MRPLLVVPLAIALAVAAHAVAGATGTTRILQQDGAVQTYPGTIIAVGASRVTFTSEDRIGQLTVTRTNCSQDGVVIRCSPDRAVYSAYREVHPLTIADAALYINATDAIQGVPYTRLVLPPHSVVLSLQTQRGTTIHVAGRIDSGTP